MAATTNRQTADSGGPDLSVVVATVEASASIDACLAALRDACAGIRAQIIVVDASRDRTAALVRQRWPDVELESQAPGTLVPRLWAAGYRRARGRLVAFTLGHLVVAPTWARALIAGVGGAAGVGGPLTLGSADATTRAVFFLRYSAFIPSLLPDGPVSGEIAGDNAAYLRQVLDRHAASIEDGFWEVEFHRLLRADGERLAATSGASAAFVASTPLAAMIRHRFDHGRHFAAGRVPRGASRLRILLAAPAVPLVLAWRVARRVRHAPDYRRAFTASLPAFLALASAWAAGEAVGAVAGS